MNQSFATLGSSDGKNKSDVKVFLFWTKMAVLHQTTSSYYMHKSSIRSVWSNWIVFHLPLQNPVKTYTKTHWPPPKTLKTLKHLHVFNKIPTFFTWKVSIPPISQPKKMREFFTQKNLCIIRPNWSHQSPSAPRRTCIHHGENIQCVERPGGVSSSTYFFQQGWLMIRDPEIIRNHKICRYSMNS